MKNNGWQDEFSYTDGNHLLTEDGPFASDTITNTYANRLRTELDLQQPTGAWTNAFAYDAAKRLTNVFSPPEVLELLLRLSTLNAHPKSVFFRTSAFVSVILSIGCPLKTLKNRK